MNTPAATVDLEAKTVSLAGKTYNLQALSPDTLTVLVAGIPVGRIVYTFGAANGVPEGDSVDEDTLTVIAEAWFAAV
jgi:hypothetical protein